jgi:hypothetical protein
MRVSDQIGTVEAGKLADVLIVNADPLADIRNMREIDTLIQNGRVVDRDFHASYSVPFAGHDPDQRYTVNDQQWARAVKREFGTGGQGANAPNPPDSPFPAIEAIAPTMIVQNSPATTLRLTGFNFVAGTQVLYDGSPVPYRRVSGTELEVTLDENLLRRAGRFSIVLKNPEPMERFVRWGDGHSNTAYLIVRYQPAATD